MKMLDKARKSLTSIFDSTIEARYKISSTDIIIIFTFFVLSCVLRQLLLLKTPFANGTDGYVYIIQIKSIVEEGRMHFKDSSLIYPYLAGLSYILKNYVLTLKTGISILTGFFTVSVYWLACLITGKKWNGILIALLALFSPSLTFFAAQFPKNFMGLVFFAFFLIFYLKKNLPAFILFFLLTFITHRLMAGIAVLFILLTVLLSLRRREIVIALLSIAVLMLIIAAVLPGTLYIADLQRFSHLFSVSFSIAPLSFIRLMGPDRINPLWMGEMLFYYWVALVAIVFIAKDLFSRKRPSKFFIILALLSIFLIFPFFSMDLSGMGYRFFLVFVPMALFGTAYLSGKVNEKWIKLAAIPAAGLVIAIYSLFDLTLFDPPYALYQRVSERTGAFLSGKKCGLIVAHKPMAEMMDFVLNRDVLPWQPEPGFTKKTTWRVAADIDIWEVESNIKNSISHSDLVHQLSPRYIIVREDIWDEFKSSIKKEGNPDLYERIFSRKNPHVMRPGYLMRFKTPSKTP